MYEFNGGVLLLGFATFAVLDFWCCGTPALVYPMKGDKIVAGRGTTQVIRGQMMLEQDGSS